MRTKLPVKTGGGERVQPGEIILLKSESNYTRIYLTDGKTELVAHTLGNFERGLQQHNFYRTHRSFIVNLNLISRPQADRPIELCLPHNLKAKVSRRRASGLIDRLTRPKLSETSLR